MRATWTCFQRKAAWFVTLNRVSLEIAWGRPYALFPRPRFYQVEKQEFPIDSLLLAKYKLSNRLLSLRADTRTGCPLDANKVVPAHRRFFYLLCYPPCIPLETWVRTIVFLASIDFFSSKEDNNFWSHWQELPIGLICLPAATPHAVTLMSFCRRSIFFKQQKH